MSSNKLIKDIRIFFQNIRECQMPQIETNILIQQIDKLCEEYPELVVKNNYTRVLSTANHRQHFNKDQSLIIQSKKKPSAKAKLHNNNNNEDNSSRHVSYIQSESKGNSTECISTPNTVILTQGDLTLRKGSTILSSFSNLDELDAVLYCRLSYTLVNNTKTFYFTVYNDQRSLKQLKQFKIDDTCVFIKTDRKTLEFKHGSDMGCFELEDKKAHEWISSLKQNLLLRKVNDSQQSLEESDSTQELTSNIASVTSTQASSESRNSFLPENVYVCLYNHNSTTKNSHELEFKCGDLLYIINKGGSKFYVGYRFKLPWNNNIKPHIGLVFKNYITPAYENFNDKKKKI